jgi:hypothetical protein
MCSGAITCTVKIRNTFRVIYGQKDEDVSSTASQRGANLAITMEGSKAALATVKMVHSGSASGKKLVTALATRQQDIRIVESTVFLMEKSTYETFFGAVRPMW